MMDVPVSGQRQRIEEKRSMYFDGSFRFIGKVDPEPLARAIESLGADAWSEYVRRQEMFQPHRNTETIPLLYDEDSRHTDPTVWPRYSELEPAMQQVLDTIREANRAAAVNAGDGYFIRIILTRLKPHCWIPRHRDGGATLIKSHRYHVAITTNPSVEFEVGDEVKHFAAGDIWEINNRNLHAVRNPTDERRIHLILDYVVPGERIEDPDGVFFA
jgi:quercetin dioxygenase-like cupin family protein